MKWTIEDAPECFKEIIAGINYSKHFGPQWPTIICEPPEWDIENYLEQINFDNLCTVASNLRGGVACKITGETFGHYNLIYFVEFEDDVQWVARIPLLWRQYTCDDKSVEEAVQRRLFESMVAAQTYARVKKGVFAPEIYAAFMDKDNPVGVPFVFMKRILESYWVNEENIGFWRLDENIGHMQDGPLRTVFRDLAREMVSLASPPYFTSIGSLYQNPNTYYVGPMLAIASLQDGPVELDKRGPYSTVEEYFLSCLNRHANVALQEQNRALYMQSTRLRALLPDLIDPLYNEGPFILSPFDWDSRDIFFSNDHLLKGVIDWDFATVVPVQAFFRYPPFMTRDWLLGTKSFEMERYRRLFRECLAEIQDETEFPLLELLDQSRWFQMLDEGIQSSEVGSQVLPLLEAYVEAQRNKQVEAKAFHVVKGTPVMKEVRSPPRKKAAIGE